MRTARSAATQAAVVTLSLMGACSHGDALLTSGDGSLRNRDFGQALGRYRALQGESCRPEGTSRLCCAALRGEADALLGANERQAALAALERTRQECPTDLEVRRKQYLAAHASDPESDAPSITFNLRVDHDLRGLGERERLLWLGLFLDGELVGHEPLTVRAGVHELEAEALLEAPGVRKSDGNSPVRLRVRQSVIVPADVPGASFLGELRLSFAGRPDSSLPENLVALQMEPVRAPSPPPAPGPADLRLRTWGDEPRFPADLLQRGEGWKVPAELCVSAEGRVQSIKVLGAAPARDPRVDAIILETLRRWRYGSYRVDGVLRGFCHGHAVDLAGG